MKKKKSKYKIIFFKYLIISFFTIYINLFQCIPLFAGSDSLIYYLELAAKNNPTVLQRYSEYQAALQKISQVGSLPDPEFTMGVFLTPMELVSGNQIADLRLMQMFPWFGVLKNAKDEMSLMANGKFELFRDAKLQVFYDVQRTWYELYKTDRDIQISEKNFQILLSVQQLALVQYKTASAGGSEAFSPTMGSGTSLQIQGAYSGSTGMQSMGGSPGNPTGSAPSQSSFSRQSNNMALSTGGIGLADLYRIQIEIGDLQNSIALLRNQQNTIVARFNSYLNRPIQAAVAIIDTLRPDTFGFSLLAVSDSMLNNNPMLGMLQYEEQSLDARKRMATRMGYPMLGIGVNYSLINRSEMSTSSMNGKDMIMPMVAITIPIYRKKYKAMQTEADLLKTATAENYAATANSLQTEYFQAIQLYQDAQRRMSLYTEQYSLANKTLDIVLKSFETSASGLTEILRIRQQILDYEFKQVEAVVDYNTAIAWMKRLGNFDTH
jgi:outer membrane protein TolC